MAEPVHPRVARQGCCDDVRKPCSFHEGYESAYEAWSDHHLSVLLDLAHKMPKVT